ncbi:hypothetical protein C1645_782576 [Glomus cerebriforme]|uniref:Histone H1 n=1 Tax=Glomus cerebriforme TaxID=658196 RepID=A0A397SHU3_9GLOM|nr:hypothetical protein C1645_782576 [Glomus cerebriforme]
MTKPNRVIRIRRAQRRYETMVRNAIVALNEPEGSSRNAIIEYILNKTRLSNNATTTNYLNLAITRSVNKGDLFSNGPDGIIKLMENNPDIKIKKKEIKKMEKLKKSEIVKIEPAQNLPKYGEMIRDAIVGLKELNGSSRNAIKKYILNKYKLPYKAVKTKRFKLAFTKGVDKGIFSKDPNGFIKLVENDLAIKTEQEEI